MSFCRQPKCLPVPTTNGIWAGFNPELIDIAEWPNAPDLSLAIDYAVRDALGSGVSLREMYQQVRSTLIAQGLQPDALDLDRCVKDHVLLAI